MLIVMICNVANDDASFVLQRVSDPLLPYRGKTPPSNFSVSHAASHPARVNHNIGSKRKQLHTITSRHLFHNMDNEDKMNEHECRL